MDTINFNLNVSKIKRPFAGDRFIPHRAKENFENAYYDFAIDVFEMEDVWPPKSRVHVNYARKFFTRQCYVERLMGLFEFKHRHKILSFSENTSFDEENLSEFKVWPVIKRKLPLIKHPETILDTPALNTNLYHNVIDWGKQQIAVVHDKQIFVWCGEKEKSISLDLKGIKGCLKFNNDGSKLAVALKHSRIGVVDMKTNKICYKATCCRDKHCCVSSFTWTKDNVLISGCTNGNLSYCFTPNRIKWGLYCAHTAGIIRINLSCNENYLATSGLDNAVNFWTYPEFERLCTIYSNTPVKALTWHPWEEPIFVCSINEAASISVWNIRSCKQLCKTVPCNDASIDCMTFNKRSGELVVSFYKLSSTKSFIAVIPNLSTLSDGIIWHIGRVPYVLWNHDSTKLLTAGSDEYVCIWNFFGNSEESVPKMKRNKNENLLKSVLNELTKLLQK